MTAEQIARHVSMIAAYARDLGARKVDLGHTLSRPGVAGELAQLSGAKREATVFRHPEEGAPYMVEVVSVDRHGVRVSAQWDRPATPDEVAELDRQLAAGQATEHKHNYVSGSLPGADPA